ncbi:MAG: XisI protein [Calothrix sp. FI2-JRJ7]|nr:XisI protein [Calothrix sp. FI2-JRJ7]
MINGKIWVQRNSTEIQIAHELVAMGISKDDIILGF